MAAVLENALLEVLRGSSAWESEALSAERAQTLNKLTVFLRAVAAELLDQAAEGENENQKKEEPPEEDDEDGAPIRVVPFGSYRLGVNGASSDVDLLCIGPAALDAERFFEGALRRLRALPPDECRDAAWVPNAVVPVCSFVYRGLEIDLVYACVPLARLPRDFDLLDERALQLHLMDAKTVLSLNGSRVTDRILQAVPAPRRDAFRAALRCVKLWARTRGVYSNKFGYLGGVSWALLVAYVCSDWPGHLKHRDASGRMRALFDGCCGAADVLRLFFHWWHDWPWPAAVQVRAPDAYERALPPVPGVVCWDPERNPRDLQQLMPILTPAHPSMSTSFNVNASTKRVLQREFRRAHELCLELASDACARDAEAATACWRRLLLEPSDFFCRYRHYLRLKATSASDTTQQSWLGWVESRVRHFNNLCEREQSVAECHIHPQLFAQSPRETHIYVGLDVRSAAPADSESTDARGVVDLSPAVSTLRQILQAKQVANETFLEVEYVRWRQLPDHVFPDARRPSHAKRERAHLQSAADAEPEHAKKPCAEKEPDEPDFCAPVRWATSLPPAAPRFTTKEAVFAPPAPLPESAASGGSGGSSGSGGAGGERRRKTIAIRMNK